MSYRLVILLLVLTMKLSGTAGAAEIIGTVLQPAGEYLLLQTDTGQQVVRFDKWTAYGNLSHMGEMKSSGELVRVSYDREVAGVAQAKAVIRETGYEIYPEQSITSEEVAAGLSSDSLVVLDVRSRQEWDEARLPGAVFFDGPMELSRVDGSQKEKKEFVLYGSSVHDLRPFHAARLLSNNSLVKVRIFTGGLKEWRSKGEAAYTSPAHLERLLNEGRPFRVADLRQPSATNSLLLTGTESLPAPSLVRAAVFQTHRPYQLSLFLYGEEAELQKAAVQLAGWGYQNDGEFALLDLTWKHWIGKYMPGKYSLGTLPAGEIGFDEFHHLWNSTLPDKLLLNVKSKRDRDVPGEYHIPLEELPERIGELPRGKEIIIYCKVGLRSAVAQWILQKNGFTSRFLNRALLLDKDGNFRADN